MSDLVGTVIADRYIIECEIGRGRVAAVWRARDPQKDRRVAIKVLHQEIAGGIAIGRFVHEVQQAARLQHPHIVPLLDSGVLTTDDGTSLPWFATTYLEGVSLRTRIARDQQLSIDDALFIALAVASALHAAHQHGLIHRDIRPENVILADGSVYVVDLGIAQALLDAGDERLTATGMRIGAAAYMSPEQAAADTIDARSDQYSLACLLYEMLTGEPPFTGNADTVMARRLAPSPQPLRAVRATIPEPVERAVLRALEPVPADRYPDVDAFAASLRAPTQGTPAAPVEAVSQPTAPPARFNWVMMAAVVVFIAASVTAWLRFGRAEGTRRAVTDPELVALYQRGLRGYNQQSAAGMADAVAAFSAAVARDSMYALAWNGMANALTRAHEQRLSVPGVPRDSLPSLALAAVQRSIAADSGSAEAWLTLALVRRLIDQTDNQPVRHALRQALDRDSTDAAAWHHLALTQAEDGDFVAALESGRRSLALDPVSAQGLGFLALGHYWQRQYDSARVWADSALAVDPAYLPARRTGGFIAIERGERTRSVAAFEAGRRLSSDVEMLDFRAGVLLAEARSGRAEDARAGLRAADSLAKTYTPMPLHTAVYLAQVNVALGDTDKALAWLARFRPVASRHFQIHLRCDPPFDPIRRDSRFQALLILPAPPAGLGC